MHTEWPIAATKASLHETSSGNWSPTSGHLFTALSLLVLQASQQSNARPTHHSEFERAFVDTPTLLSAPAKSQMLKISLLKIVLLSARADSRW